MYEQLSIENRIPCFVDNPSNTKSGQSYYSGEGVIVAKDTQLNKVCVKFSGKGCIWFNENQVKRI